MTFRGPPDQTTYISYIIFLFLNLRVKIIPSPLEIKLMAIRLSKSDKNKGGGRPQKTVDDGGKRGSFQTRIRMNGVRAQNIFFCRAVLLISQFVYIQYKYPHLYYSILLYQQSYIPIVFFRRKFETRRFLLNVFLTNPLFLISNLKLFLYNFNKKIHIQHFKLNFQLIFSF